jgi:hypothetical protein
MTAHSELLFITVPPPRSGNIVQFLADLRGVAEAVAVYTDIDVIALVRQNDGSLESTIAKIEGLGSPIESVQRCQIDCVLEGLSANKGRSQGHSSFFAFVRCTINTDLTNFEFALQRLSKIESVRFLYPSKGRSEVILQTIASDKISFDKSIMADIQDTGGMVKHTRTYIAINEMHWSDTGIPLGREEFSRNVSAFPIFMSLSSSDQHFGNSLSEQIYKDTQVRIWHYGLIKPGAESWSREVDDAICSARGFLLIVTQHFIDSSECQREFGRIEGIAKPEQICCLVLPPVKFASLPQRYQSRQCVDGKQFFAYSKLLKWVEDTV